MRLRSVFIIFTIWLIAIGLFAVFSNDRFNLKPDTSYDWINQDQRVQVQGENFVDSRSKWDSAWYIDIAENGYSYKEGSLSNIVFFPLYPVLMFLVSGILFMSLTMSGWLISTVSLLLALVVFYRLIEKYHPQIKPIEPIFYLLIFPTAFFFNVVYTESLFLLFTLLSFYFIREKKYWLAGLFGFFAAITRVTGVLLLIPFVYEFIRDKTNNFKNLRFSVVTSFSFVKSFVPVLLIPLALALFFAYHYFVFGDFFLFLEVEDTFGRAFILNKEHFTFNTAPAMANFGLDVMFAVGAFIAAILVLLRVRVSYGLYVLSALLLPLSTGSLMSIGRYVLVLFPIYILIASFKNQYIKLTYVFVSILLLATTIILFVNNYWAG